MVAHYIETQKILDICEEAVRRKGMWVYKWWWEKEGLDLEGVREAA